MQLRIQNYLFSVAVRYIGLLLGVMISVQMVAAPMEAKADPILSKTLSFTNSCGLVAPVLTPSSKTVVQGTSPVSITATGCPGGIIQYFGVGGVGTIAPGGTISVPTNMTGIMTISALCSFSGCISDVSVATVTVKPSVDPILSPVVSKSIATQTATVGTNYIFLVPANTFMDPNNDPITLTAAGLPAGLTFNGSVILGPLTQTGTSSITITATNSSGYTASTSFSLVVSPGPGGTTDPFAITAVTTINCTTLAVGKRRVTFNPTYSGLTGQPVTFSVYNEYAPTTNPGPYTLDLYIDNPAITLQAMQAGTPGMTSFGYNWLAACTNGTNTPPTVAAAIPPQSATVGQAFTYVIPANTFTDAQTPNSLTISVSGLPAGLMFTAPATISGTPSTTVGSPFNVSVKATDPGSLSVSTTFTITINPAGSPQAFALIAPTYNCQTGQFTFNTIGGDGTTIEYYAVPGITGWTTNPNQVVDTEMRTVADAPPLTLRARQSGVEVTYVWNIRQVCPVTTTVPFAITGVTTISCATVTAGARMVTFTPSYAGLNGQTITFATVNESLPTTAPGPYTLQLYTDNPVITLQAMQAGSPSASSFSYNWLTACTNGTGRLSAEPDAKLTVQLLGNPTTSETVMIDVRGAVGQPLRVQALDSQGQIISKVEVEQASSIERVSLPLGRSPGLYFLQVNTPLQKEVVKVIKQ